MKTMVYPKLPRKGQRVVPTTLGCFQPFYEADAALKRRSILVCSTCVSYLQCHGARTSIFRIADSK